MSAIISSFFSQNGTPALGLSPTIRIWEVTNTTNTLVITDAPMVEVGDGFYKYVFAGYDGTTNYVIRADGGTSLPQRDRFSISGSADDINTIREAVYEATAADHTTPGTFGLKINQTCADTAQLRLDTVAMTELLELLLKFECNRTRIDKTAKTLTVYDDDGTTPLKVFNLKDGSGTLSTAEVCERDPTP